MKKNALLLFSILLLLTCVSIAQTSNNQSNTVEQTPKRHLLKRLFNPKKEERIAKEEAAKKEKEELNKQNQELSQQVQTLDQKALTLNQQVSKQRSMISSMSAEQAKTELVLATQKNRIDSLRFNKALDSVVLQQQTRNLEQKEIELQSERATIALQHSQRYLLFALLGIVAILAGAFYLRYLTTKNHNKTLEALNAAIKEEKMRSENLLLNILPAVIAEELKNKGAAQARHYDYASVLFTDFVNFTSIAERLNPQELVSELDYCFRNFDDITKKHDLEKIKTIGDSYMCASGIPTPNPQHAQNIVRAAIEIQHFLETWNTQRLQQGKPLFETRIGIHTGPLVAGVVGTNKFAYDIWGDTVNVAARMESQGEAGRINISKNTYELVKNEFTCAYRGEIETKNKGKIEMYFVN
jgi:class 3 adenylate cyclase